MEKIKLETILSKLKYFFKQFLLYVIFVLSLGLGFVTGFYYRAFKNSPLDDKYKIGVVHNSETNLAIDEHNNLLIIDKESGNYKIYEDSIGFKIFNLYAKNLWTAPKPVEPNPVTPTK
jgi:hypothetical protein